MIRNWRRPFSILGKPVEQSAYELLLLLDKLGSPSGSPFDFFNGSAVRTHKMKWSKRIEKGLYCTMTFDGADLALRIDAMHLPFTSLSVACGLMNFLCSGIRAQSRRRCLTEVWPCCSQGIQGSATVAAARAKGGGSQWLHWKITHYSKLHVQHLIYVAPIGMKTAFWKGKSAKIAGHPEATPCDATLAVFRIVHFFS